MNVSFYLFCLVAGLLGIAIHVFGVKLPATQARAKAANLSFSYSEYFKDDLNGIISAVLTVILAMVLLDEVLKLKPEVLNFVKFLFSFIGFTGSSIWIAIFGLASKKINSVVDLKTNIADDVSNQKGAAKPPQN